MELAQEKPKPVNVRDYPFIICTCSDSGSTQLRIRPLDLASVPESSLFYRWFFGSKQPETEPQLKPYRWAEDGLIPVFHLPIPELIWKHLHEGLTNPVLLTQMWERLPWSISVSAWEHTMEYLGFIRPSILNERSYVSQNGTVFALNAGQVPMVVGKCDMAARAKRPVSKRMMFTQDLLEAVIAILVPAHPEWPRFQQGRLAAIVFSWVSSAICVTEGGVDRNAENLFMALSMPMHGGWSTDEISDAVRTELLPGVLIFFHVNKTVVNTKRTWPMKEAKPSCGMFLIWEGPGGAADVPNYYTSK